jgi:hypothetical protein
LDLLGTDPAGREQTKDRLHDLANGKSVWMVYDSEIVKLELSYVLYGYADECVLAYASEPPKKKIQIAVTGILPQGTVVTD